MKVIIEKLIYGGMGLGRLDDKPIFVRKSVPGDELEIKIIKDKGSYAEGEIKNILKESPERISPICPHFELCGGCDHMNISYKDQLKHKEEIFKETLGRAGLDIQPLPIIKGSDNEFFYRNSIRFFFQQKDNDVVLARHNYLYKNGLVPIKKCYLQSEIANKIGETICTATNKQSSHKSSFWQLKIREGKYCGEFMVEIITSDEELPAEKEIVAALKQIPEIKSIYHTITSGKSLRNLRRRLIFGSPIIFEKIGKYKFQISPESFFQTNSLGVKTLYDKIKEFASVEIGDNLLDLYCGTGTIGTYLSTLAKKVTGVEIVPEAIRDAKDNVKINHISNCEFIAGDSEKFLINNLEEFDVIIVDPPRAGLSKGLIDSLSKSKFKRLIYTSCNPATFARDVKIFEEKGIVLKKVQPIDMFPQTHHIECVGLLELAQIKK